MVIKRDYECGNGPWKGQTLFLTGGNSENVCTGVFVYKGECGRYILDPIDGKLYWEIDYAGKEPF